MGALSILSVYEGDVKITFDTSNLQEAIRAKRIISDMLRRGYSLLIEVEGAYQRALDFDEKVGEYIIADYDPTQEVPQPAAERTEAEGALAQEDGQDGEEQAQAETEGEKESKKKRKRGPYVRRVPMDSTNAVAVARSAGG